MCTNIAIPFSYKHQSLVSARTMDWVEVLPTSVDFVPRGQSFPAVKEPGEIKWRNKFAFVGAGFNGLKPGLGTCFYYDGLNEAGLSAASLFLGCTEYPKRGPSQLSSVNIVAYALGNFQNVEEAEAGLSKLTTIKSAVFPNATFHYIISDASANHLVVEFVGGKMKTYRTELGVLTNDPPYDWHLNNLVLYEQLSLTDKCNQICGSELVGSGQLGIPGDPTSQSRFVRASFLQQTQFSPATIQQGIGAARQIIQTLSVPVGTVYLREYEGVYDWTQWTVIRDHNNLGYYFFTDFNSTLYGIKFKELDLDGRFTIGVDIEQPGWVEDLSYKFQK
ncbi:linear amide C-N hydrolase [Bacillus mangrovi]|uniref:Linear amide C-N hydrolase n=1 Tax=Metabacillus mangrovi TaxID=1491830 RepID=A0A7X2S795_9BACI|nr:linear amide C-N hydrolase [Metabacillus mangrovi]MTH54947.1 linear amide C-N hydrolase [Metabacillus mangrovi]